MKTIMFYTRLRALQTLRGTQAERREADDSLSNAEIQDELAACSTDADDPIPIVIDNDQFLTLLEHQVEGRLPANVELAALQFGFSGTPIPDDEHGTHFGDDALVAAIIEASRESPCGVDVIPDRRAFQALPFDTQIELQLSFVAPMPHFYVASSAPARARQHVVARDVRAFAI